MENRKKPVVVFWFRRDLRFEDNHGLFHALSSGLPVVPLFIFDTDILNHLSDKTDARVTFIYETLEKLNTQLKAINSSLLVKIGKPEDVWKKLISEFDIQAIYFNHDYEPYAINRDEKIKKLMAKNKIESHSFKDHVIFEKNEILKSDGNPYTVFTPYFKIWKSKLAAANYKAFSSEKYLSNFLQQQSNFPAFTETGFSKSNIKVSPISISKPNLKDYAIYRNDPAADKTSKAGVHLRFGTVSIRELVRQSITISEQYLTELSWREFFIQILYHFPQVVTQSFKPAYDFIQWENNENLFQLWCNGKTGYPLVDAGMRELNTTGFMHNRVRMVVASFLCKHLLIDWRWGEAYFASKLLDYDLSANNGNWQWAAGTGCDAAPYFRIFNPSAQTERFDKDLIYTKRWVSELKEGNYIPEIIPHKYARERALKVYKKGLELAKNR